MRRQGWILAGLWMTMSMAWGQPGPALPILPALEPATRLKPEQAAEPKDHDVVHKLQEKFERALAEVKQDTDLDVEDKKTAISNLEQAIKLLNSADSHKKKAREFENLEHQTPAKIQKLKTELDADVPPPKLDPVWSLEQLEEKFESADAELTENEEELKDLDEQLEHREERRLEIPKLVAELRQQHHELALQLSNPLARDASIVAQSERAVHDAQARLWEAQMATLEAELAYLQDAGDRMRLEQELYAKKIAAGEKWVKQLRQSVNEHRRQEAEAKLAQARKDAVEAHPALAAIAQKNVELAERNIGAEGLATKLQEAENELTRLDEQMEEVQENRSVITRKLDASRLTKAIGVLLRRQQASLPDARYHQRQIIRRQAETAEIDLLKIDYKEQLDDLVDLDAKVEGMINAIDPKNELPAADRQKLQAQIEHLYDEQKSSTRTLSRNCDHYAELLLDIELKETQLINEIDSYNRFIAEHIFWVRSTTMFPGANFHQHLINAGRWLTDPQRWRRIGTTLANSPADLLFWAPIAIIGLYILRFRRRSKALIRKLGDDVAKDFTNTTQLSFQVLMLSILTAIAWPTILYMIGWRIESTVINEFGKCIGASFRSCAWYLFAVSFWKQICMPHGLAENHFRWKQPLITPLRRFFFSLINLQMPFLFVIYVMECQSTEEHRDSLGRLAFMVSQLLLSISLHRLCQPGNGALREFLHGRKSVWGERIIYLTWLVASFTPLVLLVLTFIGYYYTACNLARLLAFSFAWAASVLIGHAFASRWLFAARGKLAKEQTRRRAESQSASRLDLPKLQEGGYVVTNLMPEINLQSVNAQTRRIVKSLSWCTLLAGLWLTWADVLPALGIFRQVEVWSYTKTIAGASDVGGEQKKVVHVTLADVGSALVIIGMTIIAAKNLPGLLEITLLQQLPLDAGARYAICMMCQYAISVFGMISSATLLGFQWSNVQWLVAAVSVGLGFGLQEIFANFVSGLIILMERPIRVNDIVSVDGVTGTVSKIQIRATTIVDHDRRELIVPNREFITGKVMNWTLTDTVNRIVVKVGVGYGTDLDLARRLLIKVAEDHQLIMKDPAPAAACDEFGDNAINLTLRAYLPDFANRLSVTHELYSKIYRAFHESGIDISYPQREVHLKTVNGLPLASIITPTNAAQVEDKQVA